MGLVYNLIIITLESILVHSQAMMKNVAGYTH